ncbi:hypothetical protein LLG95_04205 [bacterium]|nr:hypothetical protein [bacterium]
MGRETRQPRNVNPKLNYKGASQTKIPKGNKTGSFKDLPLKSGKKK